MGARDEFSMKVKQAGWQRANGFCECGCGRPFGKHPKERPDYDHILPCALGGDNSLENLQVIRHDCHLAKTAEKDIKQITKARRGEKDRAGLRNKRSRLPGAKDSPYKAKIGGGWERRE